MTNPNRRKGTRWESALRDYLLDYGIPARRTGSADIGSGDVHAGHDHAWTIEAKNEARLELAAYLQQLRREIGRSGRAPLKSAVWIKRRQASPADSYVLMGGEEFRALLRYVESIETTIREIRGAGQT